MQERHPSCEVMKDFKPVNVDCDGNVKSMSVDDCIQTAADLYKAAPKDKNPYDEIKLRAARVGFEDQPELIEQAESMGITPAKLKAMKDYAAILVKQDKRIKPSTVRKKVLEKFKIKLV